MNSTFGVVSTFHPDSEVVDRIRSNAPKLDKVIVVDDGSPDSRPLEALRDQKFHVIRLQYNSGIAAALNAGIVYALSQGANFVLTLDQDTKLPLDYVDKAIGVFARSSKSTRVGIVLTDSVNGEPSIPPRFSPEGFGLVEEGIQSGMVISKECLEQVGLLDERLFIDCVDTEFCTRARDFGWNIAIAPGADITHSLGTVEVFRPLIGKSAGECNSVHFQYHPPFRRYYIARNNMDLILRNARIRPRWVASVIRREFSPLYKTLVGGPHKAHQALATTVGLWHGLTRRRGKIPIWLDEIIRG